MSGIGTKKVRCRAFDRSMKWMLAPILFASATLVRSAQAAAPEARTDFLRIIESRFIAWDADSDGELSKAEIDRLVSDPKMVGQEAAAVSALKRAVRSRKFKLPPLTQPALRQLATQPPGKDQPDLVSMFSGGMARILEVRRVLFASGKPRLETVHQGKMGNCFCLAPLAAIVHTRPDYITREMIRELPDGQYAVKLGTQIILVPAPTDAELALTSTTESDGIWVNVYEKAAGEARNAQIPEDKREATGLDALNRGGSAGTQLAFITGHEIVRFSCTFAKDPKLTPAQFEAKLEEMRAALKSAFLEKRLVTTGTLKTKIPGITPNHAYAVLGYDATTDHIKLWNPHGSTTKLTAPPSPGKGYPMTDGLFEMPLPEFAREFSGLAFEVLPKT